MVKARKHFQFSPRELVWPLLFIVGLYILLPQLKSFHSSWHLLLHPNALWLVLAAVCSGITYLAAAETYCLLATKPLSFYAELIVQLAAMFVNRLLPAGIGGIGANIEYLRHRHYKTSEAASIVATNNFLGILGHALLVALAIMLSAHPVLPAANFKHALVSATELTAALVVIAIAVFAVVSHRRLIKALKAFGQQIMAYEHRPLRTLLALAAQMVLTLTNVLALQLSVRAVGTSLSLVVVLLIFTFGSAVRNVTPTPGGLGGFEAGLVTGFIAYHVVSAQALAAVLLFRLISYWGPMVIGIIAFIWAEQKGWFTSAPG